MPVGAGTGPVLGRCWHHRPSAGPVPARNGMFTGRFCQYTAINRTERCLDTQQLGLHIRSNPWQALI